MLYNEYDMNRAKARAMRLGRKAGLAFAAGLVMDEATATWRGSAEPNVEYDDARAINLRHISNQLTARAVAAGKEANE